MIDRVGQPSTDMLQAVDPNDVTAGGMGFLVIAGLVVGTVFLLRSLNKHLKRVDFEESDTTSGEAPQDDRRDSTDGDPDDSPDASVSDGPDNGPRSSPD